MVDDEPATAMPDAVWFAGATGELRGSYCLPSCLFLTWSCLPALLVVLVPAWPGWVLALVLLESSWFLAGFPKTCNVEHRLFQFHSESAIAAIPQFHTQIPTPHPDTHTHTHLNNQHRKWRRTHPWVSVSVSSCVLCVFSCVPSSSTLSLVDYTIDNNL